MHALTTAPTRPGRAAADGDACMRSPRRADRSRRMHALTTACRPLPAQLCRDHSVDESTRLQRAHALRRIGAIFMEEALAKGGSKVA